MKEYNSNEYKRVVTKEFQNIIAEASENYYITRNNRHDKLFKEILSDKKNFEEFVITFVNKKLAELLNSEEIELYDRKFITSNFSEIESDIIYKIKDKPVYFVIEHQSTIDNNMPYRMLVYVTELIKEDMEAREEIKRSISKSYSNCN